MLTHPTHDRLVALGLTGMAKALEEQQRQPDIAALAFEERLALLVDREATERDNKRLDQPIALASLRQNAVVEDIDMQGAARARQGAVPQARRRRVDRAAPEPARSSARPASARVGLLKRSTLAPPHRGAFSLCPSLGRS